MSKTTWSSNQSLQSAVPFPLSLLLSTLLNGFVELLKWNTSFKTPCIVTKLIDMNVSTRNCIDVYSLQKEYKIGTAFWVQMFHGHDGIAILKAKFQTVVRMSSKYKHTCSINVSSLINRDNWIKNVMELMALPSYFLWCLDWSSIRSKHSQHWGKSAGGGGSAVSGVGPSSTSNAIASPIGRWASKWQCMIHIPTIA